MTDTPNHAALGPVTANDMRLSVSLLAHAGNRDDEGIAAILAELADLATARRVLLSTLTMIDRLAPGLFSAELAAFAGQLAAGYAADAEATE